MRADRTRLPVWLAIASILFIPVSATAEKYFCQGDATSRSWRCAEGKRPARPVINEDPYIYPVWMMQVPGGLPRHQSEEYREYREKVQDQMQELVSEEEADRPDKKTPVREQERRAKPVKSEPLPVVQVARNTDVAKIRPLKDSSLSALPPEAEAKPPALLRMPEKTTGSFLQALGTARKSKALKVRNRLLAEGLETFVYTEEIAGLTWWKLLLGPYKQDELERARNRLVNSGLEGPFIVVGGNRLSQLVPVAE